MSTNTERGTSERFIDDTAITAKIKAKYIADDIVKATDIKVTTENSTVILTGTVPNQDTVDQAVKIAKNTAGVEKVIPNLKVIN
jgi:osmotically-inducible protein OsmY